MESVSLNLILTAPVLRTVCWTLIHSLWIGAGISLLALIGLMVTQKSSSLVRYRLLVSCLLLFLLATGFAGFLEIRSDTHLAFNSISIQNTLQIPYPVQENVIQTERNVILQFIDNYSGWIVWLWACLLGYRMFRLFNSFRYVYKIRSGSKLLSDTQWEERLKKLAEQLNLSNKIEILESALVKVPITIGHFKPAIIVPLGFFLQLPFAQIEAILFHELAHIYRKDYMINIMQSFVDTVFFFNPALRWLSAMIREQREICCDDIVVAHTDHKSDYLKGLIAFTPSAPQTPHLTALLSLHGSLLARRLQRLIDERNQLFFPLPKVMVFLGMLVFPLLGELFLETKEKSITKSIAIQLKPQSIKTDALPIKVINKIMPYKQDLTKPVPTASRSQHQQLVIQPGKEEDLTKSTSTVQLPEKTVALSDTTFILLGIKFEHSNSDMANRVMKVKDGNGNTYLITISQNELTNLQINDLLIPKNELSKHLPLLAKIDHAWTQAQAAKKRFFAQHQSP